MQLAEILRPSLIFLADSYENTDRFYSDFSIFLKDNGVIKDQDKVKRLFIKRENVQSTAIGKGAATPHIFSEEFGQFYIFTALIKEGMEYKAPDGDKVFLVFLIMSDDRDVGLHLKSLAHIARLVNETSLVEEAKNCGDTEELYRVLVKKERELPGRGSS